MNSDNSWLVALSGNSKLLENEQYWPDGGAVFHARFIYTKIQLSVAVKIAQNKLPIGGMLKTGLKPVKTKQMLYRLSKD